MDNFRGYLTERVVAIDLDAKYIGNHRAPEGQRFHFMKAENESVSQAYNNGIEFIKLHAEGWVAGTL